MPNNPRPGPILLLMALAGVVQGCDSSFVTPETSTPRAPGLTVTAHVETTQQPVHYEFAAYLPVADAGPSDDILFAYQTLAETVFTSGWNVLAPEESGKPSAWSGGGDAVVDLMLISPAPRTARFTLSRPPVPDLMPEQQVEILWNDAALGHYEVSDSANAIDVAVPADVQRPGPNRIRIRPKNAIALGGRTLGVELTQLELALPSRSAGPKGDRVRTLERSILQKSNTVLTLYFVVPENARLSGAVSSNSSLGRASIVTLDDANRSESVFSSAFETNSPGLPQPLDLDLASYAGKPLAFTLAYESEDESEVRWQGVTLSGTQPMPAVTNLANLQHPYNVLLILFDTLRADHTQPYGGDIQTPHLDRFANEGAVFPNAHSTMPWTRGSVTSLFTSLFPTRHNLVLSSQSLPVELPTLPEVLHQAGYATTAVLANPTVSAEFGMTRGFDTAHEIFRVETAGKIAALATPKSRAELIWDEYIGPAVEQPEKPFFVYLHEIDPHGPWTPPEPYDALYTKERRPGYNVTPEMVAMLRSGEGTLSDADRDYLHALYSAEVTFMDEYLGTILARLAEAGRDSDTLVVFVSDHGEEFLEHGLITHGHSLYEELLQVPILFRLPGRIPSGIRPTISATLADITPTILDLTGVGIGREMQGISLLPWLLDEAAAVPERATYGSMGTQFHPLDSDSVMWGPWKLILRMTDPMRSPQREFALFNVEQDSAEIVNLWAEQCAWGGALRQAVAWRRHTDSRGQVASEHVDVIDPEIEEQLHTLGYID